eukprot:TRINITY_DN25266_c0_g1_i1.p1 TRINITY_DN25266_c0_g1~~TRINITY_DN25266_c0_g1_i1.p1  ORF type:complete len:462 (-),score=57.71 TRINITY_DN25266_c0_g1_i1:37-1422(-)
MSKKHIPCKYFPNCPFGPTCMYGHGNTAPKPTAPVCKFWPNCTNKSCKFTHPGDASSQVAAVQRPNQVNVTISASNPEANESETLNVQITRSRLVFSCQIDSSGSMAGGKLRQAIAGLKDIFDIMREDDLFACYTFAQEVKKLHHLMPKKDVVWGTDASRISKNLGGGTALYDAVKQALDGPSGLQNSWSDLKKVARQNDQTFLFEQLVITDGEDNCSKRTYEELKASIEKPHIPNYHLIVIGVGKDCDIGKLQRLCEPRHATFHHVQNPTELHQKLQDIRDKVKLMLTVQKDDNQKLVEWEGTRRGLKPAIQAMATHAPLLSQKMATDKALMTSLNRALDGGPAQITSGSGSTTTTTTTTTTSTSANNPNAPITPVKVNVVEGRGMGRGRGGYARGRGSGYKNKVEELENQTTCVVCLSAPRAILFRPCNHYHLCEACAARVDKCTTCRKPIEERIKVFQ